MIIGLVGNEHVGKDTVANYLKDVYNFRKYSLADPIKNISQTLFGWTNEQLYGDKKDVIDAESGIIPREFLKWIGTDIFQFKIHEKFPELKINNRCFWANCMKHFIETHSSSSHIVVSDVRFKHEAEIIIDAGGFLIYIDRDGSDLNSSDNYEIQDLINEYHPINNKPWIFDVIDNNETIEDLEKNIDNVLNNIETYIKTKIIDELDN